VNGLDLRAASQLCRACSALVWLWGVGASAGSGSSTKPADVLSTELQKADALVLASGFAGWRATNYSEPTGAADGGSWAFGAAPTTPPTKPNAWWGGVYTLMDAREADIRFARLSESVPLLPLLFAHDSARTWTLFSLPNSGLSGAFRERLESTLDDIKNWEQCAGGVAGIECTKAMWRFCTQRGISIDSGHAISYVLTRHFSIEARTPSIEWSKGDWVYRWPLSKRSKELLVFLEKLSVQGCAEYAKTHPTVSVRGVHRSEVRPGDYPFSRIRHPVFPFLGTRVVLERCALNAEKRRLLESLRSIRREFHDEHGSLFFVDPDKNEEEFEATQRSCRDTIAGLCKNVAFLGPRRVPALSYVTADCGIRLVTASDVRADRDAMRRARATQADVLLHGSLLEKIEACAAYADAGLATWAFESARPEGDCAP
jgi:hypothetical protein